MAERIITALLVPGYYEERRHFSIPQILFT
jgi:hypothetical protein